MAGNVTAFNTVWTYDLYQAYFAPNKSDEADLRRPFVPHAVDRSHVEAVGDGVGALDGAPRIVLGRTAARLPGGTPADGRGIEQHLGAGQGRQAGRLGIPLVPADQRRHAGESRIEAGKTQVAGGEVILLVIARIVGDVHFAIDPQQRAIGVDDQGGVVIDARRAPLEDRPDDGHLEFPRQARETFGSGPGNRLGQIEQGGVLLLAEVLRAEQFLDADDLRALASGFANAPFGLGEVFVGVLRTSHLDQTDAELGALHRTIVAAYDCI